MAVVFKSILGRILNELGRIQKLLEEGKVIKAANALGFLQSQGFESVIKENSKIKAYEDMLIIATDYIKFVGRNSEVGGEADEIIEKINGMKP